MLISQLLFIVFYGCGSKIQKEFMLEQQKALSTTSIAPRGWEPDVRLRIDYEKISQITKDKIQKRISVGKFNTKYLVTISGETQNQVKKIKFSDMKEDNRFEFTGTVTGRGQIKAAFIPFNTSYALEFRGLAFIELIDGQFQARLDSVEEVSIGFKEKRTVDLTKTLKEWIEERVSKMPPVKLGKVDLKELQMQSARVKSSPHRVDLELLSSSTMSSPLKLEQEKPKGDWDLQISQDLAKSWMKREAFKLGPQTFGILADPRDLSVEKDKFRLLLRLWKIKGLSKWWQEYLVEGDILVWKNHLELKHRKSTKGDSSPFALSMIPKTLIGDQIFINAIAQKVDLLVPNHTDMSSGGKTLKATFTDIEGRGNAVIISGEAKLSTKAPDTEIKEEEKTPG